MADPNLYRALGTYENVHRSTPSCPFSHFIPLRVYWFFLLPISILLCSDLTHLQGRKWKEEEEGEEVDGKWPLLQRSFRKEKKNISVDTYLTL